jgi:phosphatidylserine/phosphatidylglycerophosphate/cardiolipin synthase-like enzyme
MKKLMLGLAIGSAVVCGGAVGAFAAGDYYITHPTYAEIAFTKAGQHPELLLESAIKQAHSSLDVAIYSITKTDIVNAIVAAKKRGVKVRIITDRTEASNKYQRAALTVMKNAGIPIKVNKHSGLMHLKVAIIDNKIVATGSYNYSTAASTTNDENLVVLHDSTMAKDYEIQFNRMWNDTKGFTNWK